MSMVVGKIENLSSHERESVLRDARGSVIGVEAKGNHKQSKQSMLLTKEEIRLIERIRHLCRRPKNCLVIVEPGCFLSWCVTGDKES
jgi:hypothetical protein